MPSPEKCTDDERDFIDCSLIKQEQRKCQQRHTSLFVRIRQESSLEEQCLMKILRGFLILSQGTARVYSDQKNNLMFQQYIIWQPVQAQVISLICAQGSPLTPGTTSGWVNTSHWRPTGIHRGKQMQIKTSSFGSCWPWWSYGKGWSDFCHQRKRLRVCPPAATSGTQLLVP